MKQLLILSGKGGTGKTTVASAFIKLSNAKVYADCDVDAPNLHLVLSQNSDAKISDYYGLGKAIINSKLCVRCNLCFENCRFDAVKVNDEYKVDCYACEGCGVCEAVCPVGAVSMNAAVAGETILYNDDAAFSTAELKMGSGTSGKLVAEVKKNMRLAATNAKFAIVDGSPGIGCPVIASLSGVDMVLIVAEPSVSGISDMERIIKTAEIFKVKTTVCVNKYDTNIENTEKIESFCKEFDIPFLGRIPYDINAVKAINDGKSIVDVECNAGKEIKNIFDNIVRILHDLIN